jgi:peptide/nickel transport system permease protein
MNFQPVVLWSDLLLWGLVLAGVVAGWVVRRDPLLLAAWRKVINSGVGMSSATIVLAFIFVGLLDSVHYRAQLPGKAGADGAAVYAVEVLSGLDRVFAPLRTRVEKTYSAPLDTHSFAKETIEAPDGTTRRDYPRLKYGGQHLGDEAGWAIDVAWRVIGGLALGVLLFLGLALCLLAARAALQKQGLRAAGRAILRRESGAHWQAMLLTLLCLCLFGGVAYNLGGGYHLLGTDKVGQDVLYQVLKSVRTALIIGLLTTLVTLPIGIGLGVAAGYFRGWVDDVIQYVYTTLNSIPGVLLIAAAALMMQTIIDLHPEWFSTAAERADMRLLALCLILGMTSWTGLARLLRGETLKLSQLEYVQAAQAFGVSRSRILARHILPNVMHIVIIALVMDFSGLVLAEAVLSYVGIGVDPTMISFGTMINNARMELSREPVVWWSLAGAFVAMFTLVLSANLLADVVRDAFDPRHVESV